MHIRGINQEKICLPGALVRQNGDTAVRFDAFRMAAVVYCRAGEGGFGMLSVLPDLVVQIGLFVLLFLPRGRRCACGRWLLAAAVYIYFCAILWLTLLPVLSRLPQVPGHVFSANLRPFRDLLCGWGDSVGQLLLNVLLFMPFGILLPPLTGRGFVCTLLQAAACSVGIELLQPFFDRTCDITDLITNVTGCAGGYLVGLPLRQSLSRMARPHGQTKNRRR